MSALTLPTFGALLRNYRVAASLTQEELAERAGLSPRAIIALERGERRKPYRQTIALLATGLALPPQDTELLQRAAGYLPADPERLARDAAPAVPPLVGRVDELATIERFLIFSGPPVLMIAGEPGIGKSRLLQGAAQLALAAGYTVLQGGGQRRSGLEPYAPLLQTLARSLSGPSPAQLRTALTGCDWLARLLPELQELARVPVPAGTLPPDQERRLVFAAVARYLTNIAGLAGTLLLLDDLQWSSPDGLDLLASLIQRADDPVVRVIGAYRINEVKQDHPLSALLAELAEQDLVHQQALDPLEEKEAQALLDILLQRQERGEDQAIKQRIVRRAGGVPFFLMSCVHGLEMDEQGESVPWTLAQSIGQRVAALPRPAQEVLHAAAILGRVIQRAILAAMVRLPESEVIRSLDAAGQARLLLPEGRSTYRFAHDVVREVIEASLDPGERLLLHRKAAEVLERHPEGTRHAAALAWHFREGDDPVRALPYALLAGDQAEAVFAHGEAELQYRTALELARELEDRTTGAEVLERLGAVLKLLARYAEALEVLEQAAQVYRSRGDPEGEGRVVAQIAWAGLGGPRQWSPAVVTSGIARVHAALERWRRREHSASQVALYEVLATMLSYRGEQGQALEATERAVELAGALGDQGMQARGLASRGMILSSLGRQSEALESLERAISLAENAGDRETMGRALKEAAQACERAGQTDGAGRYTDRFCEVARQLGSPAMISESMNMAGWAAYLRGNWDEARSHWEEGASILRQIEGTVLALPAGLRWQQGEGEPALRDLKDCVSAAERTGDVLLLSEARYWLAQADLLAGNMEAVVARLEPVLDPDVAGSDQPMRMNLLLSLAQAYLELDRKTEAEDILAEVLTAASAAETGYALAEALPVQGMVLARGGRWREADIIFEESLRHARTLPYPLGEAQALLARGRMEAERGKLDEARERLEESLAIFRRLGARPYVERTEKSLADLPA